MGSINVDLLEPEVHIVGEIEGGSGLNSNNSFCLFSVKCGKEWICVGGDEKGQTQVDYPEDDDMAIWNHPIDLHYFTKTLQGWPKVVLEVWHLDTYGGRQLLGYGFFYIPSEGGSHDIECPIWRPCGTRKEEVYDFYLGGVPHVKTDSYGLLYDSARAKDERCRLFTKTAGTVHIHLDVILRNMKPHKVKSKAA